MSDEPDESVNQRSPTAGSHDGADGAEFAAERSDADGFDSEGTDAGGIDPDATTTDSSDAHEPDADPSLAAVVAHDRVAETIEGLRAEGRYDDDRRILEHDDAHLAVPITGRPRETHVADVIEQPEPVPRTRGLESILRQRGWDDADLERVPASWAVVGDVILVGIPEECPDETAVAEALLELHGGADLVLADEGVVGRHREPRTRRLAGEGDPETIHVEAGTRYALDPTKVMFSPGNKAERIRMGEVVEPGERVFDMFAGIGYFTLPMARAGAHVTAAEINPTAFRYLLENAALNDVTDRIEAYRADCRDVADGVAADRVVMGYYDPASVGTDDAGPTADAESADSGAVLEPGPPDTDFDPAAFLAHAVAATDPGGTIHYHDVGADPEPWSEPIARVRRVAEERDRSLEIVDRRRVKSIAPGLVHVVLDVVVAPGGEPGIDPTAEE